MENNLYLIYNFSESESFDGSERLGKYKILLAYDRDGNSELINDFAGIEFSEKEHMLKRVQDFMEEFGIHHAKILAVNDFNVGIESCHTTDDILRLFDTHGTSLALAEGAKKSILGRLF